MTSEIVSRSIFRSSDTLEGALIRILNERNQRFRDPELRYPIVYQGLAMFSYLLRKAIHEGKVRYRRPIPTVPNVLHPPEDVADSLRVIYEASTTFRAHILECFRHHEAVPRIL